MARKTLAFDIPAIINSMDLSPQVKRAYLSATYPNSVKRVIARGIADRIVERTQSGIDKDGDRFVGYKPSYKKSLAFKVYGKSNKVDLTLTGAMLSSVTVISVDSTTVKIGFTDNEQFQKASGHIDGTGANNALPVRDFWGLPLEDVQEIITSAIKESGQIGLIEELNEVISQPSEG